MIGGSLDKGVLDKYGIEVLNKEFDTGRIKGYGLDLDETCYTIKDNAHFGFYAERLRERISTSSRENFDRIYATIKSGKSPAKIGRAYDKNKELFIEFDLQFGYVSIKYMIDWSGRRSSASDHYEKSKIEGFSRAGIFPISDGWDLAAVAAYKCGIAPEKREEAHTLTKDELRKGKFEFVPADNLAKFLDVCRNRGIKLAVSSNTKEEENLEGVLSMLGVQDKFDYKRCDAQKLESPRSLFEDVSRNLELPDSNICYVGNNVLNDLRPGKRRSSQTILVEVDKGQDMDGVDIVVPSFGSWINFCLGNVYR